MRRRLALLLLLATMVEAAPKCVTHIPAGPHTDYFLWPFKLIPRAWTAHPSCKPPKLVFGQRKIVPDPGHKAFWFSLRYGPMFTFQTAKRHLFVPPHFLFRAGSCRWDDVDNYYDCPTLRFNVKRD